MRRVKRKPIKIDWNDLESAFNNKNEELQYHLDLVTGQVTLEGEGEEDDYDDEDVTAPAPVHKPAADTRVLVEPATDAQKLVWLGEFLGREELDPDVVKQFRAAMEPADVTTIRELMNRHDEVRDPWYLFRSERVRELIDRWLESHDIQVANPPPWR